jgi:hypothetical protein
MFEICVKKVDEVFENRERRRIAYHSGSWQIPFTHGVQVGVGLNAGVAVHVGVGVGVPCARAGGVTRRAKSTKRKQPRATRQQNPALLRNHQRRVRLDAGGSEVLGR